MVVDPSRALSTTDHFLRIYLFLLDARGILLVVFPSTILIFKFAAAFCNSWASSASSIDRGQYNGRRKTSNQSGSGEADAAQ
ncbi:amino acid ABC transporter permease [Anopheles sinensis]|uniref:Amino acid ABC transporter permease n=1 Tax=Anopheles sinensis TaxID=74873 RepID=A0A084VLM6_ANOSI|nr:amino acid ABC transporter permease [Anopheles sinensis]